MGLLTLPLGMVRLNRAGHHFFFQHRNPDSAHQFGDQIEDNGRQNPYSGTKGDTKEAKECHGPKEGCPLEGKGIPAERGQELLDVVDGARCRAHIPQQEPREENHDVQGGMKNDGHFENAPRINISDDTGDFAHAMALSH
jgi:hypothetical protein